MMTTEEFERRYNDRPKTLVGTFELKIVLRNGGVVVVERKGVASPHFVYPYSWVRPNEFEVFGSIQIQIKAMTKNGVTLSEDDLGIGNRHYSHSGLFVAASEIAGVYYRQIGQIEAKE